MTTYMSIARQIISRCSWNAYDWLKKQISKDENKFLSFLPLQPKLWASIANKHCTPEKYQTSSPSKQSLPQESHFSLLDLPGSDPDHLKETVFPSGDISEQISEAKLTLTDELSTASESSNETSNETAKIIQKQWFQELQYPANSPCEDTIASNYLQSIEAYVISIFDGHGGPQLAIFCKEQINLYLDQYICAHKQNKEITTVIKEALKQAYEKIEKQFFLNYEKELREGNNSIRNVGTCAITVVLYKGTAYIANAGDSQAMIISQKEDNSMSFKVMNERLSTSNPTEKKRILTQFKDKEEENNLLISDGDATYLKGRLQPTRTIGDYYLKDKKYYTERSPYNGPYLNCKPDIKQIEINPCMKYLVVASDGVWDYLSNKKVTQLVMSTPKVNLEKRVDREELLVGRIFNEILEKCSRNTKKDVREIQSMLPGQRRRFHDDITIGVVDLQSMPK